MNLFFKKGIQDIPMTQEAGKQYLPWIFGLLVFLLQCCYLMAEGCKELILSGRERSCSFSLFVSRNGFGNEFSELIASFAPQVSF